MRPGAAVQAGDHDGIVSAERRHHQFAAQESSACQVLSDLLGVLADLRELAQDFCEIYGADRRATKQRLLDHVSASLIVEIGKKG